MLSRVSLGSRGFYENPEVQNVWWWVKSKQHNSWKRVVLSQQFNYKFKSNKCVCYYLRTLQRRKWKVEQHILGKVECRVYCIQHRLTHMHAHSPHCFCCLSLGGQRECIKGASNPISIWKLDSWPRDVHELNEQCPSRSLVEALEGRTQTVSHSSTLKEAVAVPPQHCAWECIWISEWMKKGSSG